MSPRRRAISATPEVVQSMAEVVAARVEQGRSLDSPMIYAQVALLVEAVLGRAVEVSPEARESLVRVGERIDGPYASYRLAEVLEGGQEIWEPVRRS